MVGLAGKVALITGGAKGKRATTGAVEVASHPPPPPLTTAPLSHAGIGFACAQALGRAGARVLVADIDAEGVKAAEAALLEEGIEASSTVCDVGDKQQLCGWGRREVCQMPCIQGD